MDTRERLIETTRDLLWERGYVGTSPKVIQQRSGAGQGRTPARKQALYQRIAELACEYAGTEPRNMFVTLCENEPVD